MSLYEEHEHPRGEGGRWTDKPDSLTSSEDQKLTDKDRKLIKRYRMHGEEIDKKLRFGSALTPEMQRDIKSLDYLIDTHKLSEPMTVYRGFAVDIEPKPGNIISQPGYTAVFDSLLPLEGAPGIMEIKLPKGAQALDTGPFDVEGQTVGTLLLPRDEELHFTGKQGNIFQYEVADQSGYIAPKSAVEKSGENIRIVHGLGEPVIVNVNPSELDLRNIIKESDDEVARILIDRDNNLYAWNASQAIHAAIWNALEVEPKDWDQFIIYKGKIAAIGAIEGQGLRWNEALADYAKPDVERARDLLKRAKKLPKKSKAAKGVSFVSPNVRNIDFTHAVDELSSRRQKSLLQASRDVDIALTVNGKLDSVIGAWADGAENSLMDWYAKIDWDTLTVSGAMKGWLADQKSVLVFQPQPNGTSILSNFEAKGELADIHNSLLEDGLAFHTLVPTEDGAKVYVVDLDGSALEAVKKGAERYDAEVEVEFGKAEFIGTTKEDGTDREQRDSAREVYEGIIAKSPVQGSQKIWQRIRDRWGKTLGESSQEDKTRPSAA